MAEGRGGQEQGLHKLVSVGRCCPLLVMTWKSAANRVTAQGRVNHGAGSGTENWTGFLPPWETLVLQKNSLTKDCACALTSKRHRVLRAVELYLKRKNLKQNVKRDCLTHSPKAYSMRREEALGRGMHHSTLILALPSPEHF